MAGLARTRYGGPGSGAAAGLAVRVAPALLPDPAVRQLLEGQGLTAVGGSAADFKRTIDGDVKRWGPVITRLSITLD